MVMVIRNLLSRTIKRWYQLNKLDTHSNLITLLSFGWKLLNDVRCTWVAWKILISRTCVMRNPKKLKLSSNQIYFSLANVCFCIRTDARYHKVNYFLTPIANVFASQKIPGNRLVIFLWVYANCCGRSLIYKGYVMV